uniref:Major histocompatibility complex, class II, B n=3 Tax=Coturnix japonica TaxID=93934 RepID=Q76BY9_COTJA|nr:major histocompatibility complex, class II, B [Coturnix japonica]BAD13691.1 major histocompatibility complex, class II, B [Coturnix japonica]
MGSGRVPAAVAVLVALLALGARSAYGTRPSAFFKFSHRWECRFLNGTERVRLVAGYIYNRQQYTHFDSDVGKFVADTTLGEFQAEHHNSQTEFLEYLRGAVDTVCRHNYEILESITVQRSVQPKVRVSALQSGSLGESDRLACYVTGFYPPEIEVKWFQNGREETERVVSTDVMQNGDWTYQVLVVLETVPRRGDSYECRVEHASLPQGISQPWEPPSDAGRSKMLTGVGGFVLGLVFLALGLFMFLRSQKGERWAAGLSLWEGGQPVATAPGMLN